MVEVKVFVPINGAQSLFYFFKVQNWYTLLTLICMKYFRTLLHEIGPQEPTKENAQLNRQNDFSFTWIKLVYCLIRKTLWCNSLVQKICMFLQKETSHCRSSSALGPRGPKHYIFGNQFYSKNAKKLRFHVFLHFHARKHMLS